MSVRIKLYILALLLLLIGCKEDAAITHTTYYIDQSTKEWYMTNSIVNFTMIDSKGIRSSYTQTSNYVEFSGGKTTIAGIPTNANKTENKYQAFSSTYGITFSVSFYPHNDGYGDEITIHIGDYSCSFDLLQEKVTTVHTPFGSASLLMTNKGYKQLENVKSIGEILAEYTVLNKIYTDVLHITINDFIPDTEPYAIREIYYTKHFGLLAFVYANGESQERISE